MATFNKTSLGFEINDPLVAKFAEIDAALGVANANPLLDAEAKGYIQRRNVFSSPIEQNIPLFIDKLRKHKGKDENQGDINVVLVDGSISTDMDYASERSDAPYRPPMSTEMNLPSMIQDKIHYKEQQYRRFDAMADPGNPSANFTEVVTGGTATTVIKDLAWDWQYSTIQSQAWNNRLTRILTGTAPSVSFSFRNSYRRMDFIYCTDYISSDAISVSVTGGAGYFQLYDEVTGVWKEAHGHVFSSRENGSEGAIRTAPFPWDTAANDSTTTYRKSMFQKRLKFRRTLIAESRNVTLTSTDGGRICYWGNQWSTNDYMFNFINSSRGSHNIMALRLFEAWDVDYWKPDLILFSCNTINEMVSSAGGVAIADTPALYTSRFTTYINSLMEKAYKPEIFAYVLFINMNQQPVDVNGRYVTRTISSGLGGNAVVVDDFFSALYAGLKSVVYPAGYGAPLAGVKIASASVYRDFMRYGIRRYADINPQSSSSLFQELFGYTSPSGSAVTGKTGRTGTAVVSDGTHLNDTGAFLAWRYLEKYFEF